MKEKFIIYSLVLYSVCKLRRSEFQNFTDSLVRHWNFDSDYWIQLSAILKYKAPESIVQLQGEWDTQIHSQMKIMRYVLCILAKGLHLGTFKIWFWKIIESAFPELGLRCPIECTKWYRTLYSVNEICNTTNDHDVLLWQHYAFEKFETLVLPDSLPAIHLNQKQFRRIWYQ